MRSKCAQVPKSVALLTHGCRGGCRNESVENRADSCISAEQPRELSDKRLILNQPNTSKTGMAHQHTDPAKDRNNIVLNIPAIPVAKICKDFAIELCRVQGGAYA